MTQFLASSQIAGKTCPFCQSPIKPGVPIEVCDSCQIPHHVECWASNGGCTTFGCAGAGAPRPIGQAPAAGPYPGQPAPGGYGQPPAPPTYPGFYSAPPAYQQPQPGWPPNSQYQQQAWPAQPYGMQPQMWANDSGMGPMAILPPELKEFSWGGFVITFWWSIFNRSYIGLLCLVPYLGWYIMPFVVGFRGNEWAWQNRRWESIEHFRHVQQAWNNWGIALFVISIIVGICIGVAGAMNGS